jgi:hypothetical protein
MPSIGAGASVYGSSQAAGASKDAANLQAQTAAANAARAQPYVDVGNSAASQLQALNTSGFTAGQPNYLQMSQDAMPGQMTQAQLEQTPGYQFQLNQGLQATQNSAAARGLGVSGAALKGAAAYATGLADSNYQNQFNNAQTRSQDYLNLNTGQQSNAMNLYNRLAGTTTIGANAASGVATNQSNSAATQGGYIQGAGNAAAAGASGVGNAVTGAANNYLTYNMLNNMTGGGGTGASGAAVGNMGLGGLY